MERFERGGVFGGLGKKFRRWFHVENWGREGYIFLEGQLVKWLVVEEFLPKIVYY